MKKSMHEIQYAHDLVEGVLSAKARNRITLSGQETDVLTGSGHVLCWVLGHEAGNAFAGNLQILKQMLDRAGIEMVPKKPADSPTPPIPLDGEAIPMTDEALERFIKASSDFAPDTYECHYDEGQRQMMLLALHKLRLERPGWDYAIGEIEKQLGGQLAWPVDGDYGSEAKGA